ncbi:hypothetical protein ACFLYH_00195 [Candidatus Dependentiae bacterium]
MNFSKTKKSFLFMIFFSILTFNSSYFGTEPLDVQFEVGTAVAKFPLAVIQNYLECSNKLKEAKVAEILYLANEITNILIKMNNHFDDVSFLKLVMEFMISLNLLEL